MENNKKYTVVCYEFPYNKNEPKKFFLEPASVFKEAVDAVDSFIQSDFENETLQEGARRDNSKPKPFLLFPSHFNRFLNITRQFNMFDDLFYPGAVIITNTEVIEEGYEDNLNPMEPIPLAENFDIKKTALRVFIIKNMEVDFLWPFKKAD